MDIINKGHRDVTCPNDVPMWHGVRPGTERSAGMFAANIRGTAFCGADVFVYQGREFDPTDKYVCKRCSKAAQA